MFRLPGAACAVALALPALPCAAQVSTPATPRVGVPTVTPSVGPPAPAVTPGAPMLVPRDGPLPPTLTLPQALAEAEARSPAILAAGARIEAAEARVGQAGVRSNPELSVELEDAFGTGDLSGLRSAELTVSVSQRLDMFGRRRARIGAAEASLAADRLRLDVARADLAQAVREAFAQAATARDRLLITREELERAQELARVAGLLVEVGREPPLRALRARSAAAQAEAALRVAEAEDQAARRTLAALFGVDAVPDAVLGDLADAPPTPIAPERTLEVRLAELEVAAAEAEVRQQQVAARLDPAVGVGIRRNQERDDFGLVAGVSVPIPLFDRNRGNVAAARAGVRAAEASRAAALATATTRLANAQTALTAAEARLRALEGAAIPEATEALRLSELAYRAGKIGLQELLAVRDALSSARRQVIDARLERARAVAALVRATAFSRQD